MSVSKDSGTDSAFVAGGAITVTNPHPSETLTATLSDPGADIDTSVISIAPGGTQTIGWSRSDGDVNPGSTTNVASFSLYDIDYIASVTYSYGEPTTLVDDSVVVGDTNDAFGPDLSVSVSSTWVYDVAFDCETESSTTYPNTASFTGILDSGSASASVVVDCFADDSGSGDGSETAFMFGEQPFCDFIPRWGWTEYVDYGTFGHFDQVFPIYAGAGQCDVTKGTLVGFARVISNDFTGGLVQVTMLPGWYISEMHMNVSPTLEINTANGTFNQNHAVSISGDETYASWYGAPIDNKWIILHLAVDQTPPPPPPAPAPPPPPPSGGGGF